MCKWFTEHAYVGYCIMNLAFDRTGAHDQWREKLSDPSSFTRATLEGMRLMVQMPPETHGVHSRTEVRSVASHINIDTQDE